MIELRETDIPDLVHCLMASHRRELQVHNCAHRLEIVTRMRTWIKTIHKTIFSDVSALQRLHISTLNWYPPGKRDSLGCGGADRVCDWTALGLGCGWTVSSFIPGWTASDILRGREVSDTVRD